MHAVKLCDAMSLSQHYGPIFLQVERSILGRRWRARLDSIGETQSLALTQAYGLDDLLARILVGRGIAASDLENYLNPSLDRKSTRLNSSH